MAWIDKKQRSDGGISARVVWRLGGSRDGAYQSETFSAGTDAVNMERARGFKSMVDAAGQHWPEGWVRGEGFVRPSGGDPMRPPPCFHELGEEYVRQIVDLSPGQRKRYLGQLRVLAVTRVQGELVFTKPVTSITEAECEAAVRLAGPYGDLITVAVGTGLRFGEITALWVSDVDLTRRTIRVSKVWKRGGEAGARDTPAWLTKSLTPKHAMREHYLGNPKTANSSDDLDLGLGGVRVVPAVGGKGARRLRLHHAPQPASAQRRLPHPRLAQADDRGCG